MGRHSIALYTEISPLIRFSSFVSRVYNFEKVRVLDQKTLNRYFSTSFRFWFDQSSYLIIKSKSINSAVNEKKKVYSVFCDA
jgi:hypothetical protein